MTYSDTTQGEVTLNGYWVQQGKAIALTVTETSNTTQTPTYVGCLFLGIIKTRSINSAAREGPINCSSYLGAWYATKSVT
jgi:Na+/glutamate symporter